MRSCALALLLAASCGRYRFDEVSLPDDADTLDADDPGLFAPIALAPGGTANRIVLAPSGDVYVTFLGHGAYRSSDSGQSWTACGAQDARHVAVTTDGTVYIADKESEEVYASSDACAHWRPTGLNLYAPEIVAAGTTIFAGTTSGLRAYDGASWRVVSTPFEGMEINGLAVHQSTIMIGSIGGVARSADNGQNWTIGNTGLINLNVGTLAIAPSMPTRVYAAEETAGGTTGALYRSDDGGATWASVYPNGGSDIAVSPTDPNDVLYASYITIVESTDGTNFFDVRTPAMENSAPLGATFDALGGAYLATTRGVFYRQGTGAFAPRESGLDAWLMVDSAMTPSRDAIYWTTSAGLLYSQDEGTTYALASGIGFDADLQAVVVPANAPATVLASGRVIGKSTDRGSSFVNDFDVGAANGYHVWDFATTSTGRVIAGTRTQILVADPPWTTWNAVIVGTTMGPCYALAVIAGDEIVATCADGVFHSTDLGGSFQPMSGPPSTLDLPIAGPQGQLLGATADGLWSFEAGAWKSHGLAGLAVHDVLFAGATWVAATESGVYVSHDDGVTWSRLAGLAGCHPLLLERHANGDLLVGTAGHGLYRSPFP